MLVVAAEAIFWLHAAVIAFNLFGLVVIPIGLWRAWPFVRVFWWRALHLVALLVVALQALLQRACFLTIWEDDLAARAGETPNQVPLIQGWVSKLVYWRLPLWVFAALYVGIFLYTVLLWYFVPPRWPRFGRSRR